MHLLNTLRRSFLPSIRKSTSKRGRARSRGRTLAMESLEGRQMLSITPLQGLSAAQDTGEKSQSKMFEYAGQWWSVMPIKGGTWVFRLDGTTWTPTQQITTNSKVHADVKVDGDLIHVLMYNGTKSQFATLQYDAGPDNRFEPWSLQPQVVNIPLSKGVETATIEKDSTGRLWIASDAKTTIEVRYSDGLYTTWSAPITVASGIKSDDISAIIAMPNDQIGVFWSNQSTKRFGFRVHVDGAAPDVWSADEIPGSQSALNIGKGMADDHMHLAADSNGTLYAAVKTSYDKSGYPKMGLLVRRPDGAWDDFYGLDDSGTRPVVVVDEVAGKLIVAHTTKEGGGDIVYNESPLDDIAFGSSKILISGKVNNVTTAKVTSSNQIVFMASGKSVMFEFDAPAPPVVQTLVAGSSPTEISFQDGLFPNVAYVGTSDTQINGSAATQNHGTSQTLEMAGNSGSAALLKWDVSAIPSDSILVSAAIELNVTDPTAQDYEVYALQKAWDELSATWQQFADGQNWSGDGAGGPGDHGIATLGSLGAPSSGTVLINLNDAGLAAVQSWINDADSNFGVILKDYLASDAAAISAREAAVAAQRPKLAVNFTPATTVSA